MSHQSSEIERTIAALMSARLPVEKYLQQGAPLTEVQLQSISMAVMGLQTFLLIWKRKTGKGQ